MSKYGSSRATSKISSNSRHNPLNTNTANHLYSSHTTQTTQTHSIPNHSSDTDSISSSHTVSTCVTELPPITPPSPQPTIFGVLKSVFVNVVKPVIAPNTNDTTTPYAPPHIQTQTGHRNDDNTVRLLDNEALTERVLEIVQLEQDTTDIKSKKGKIYEEITSANIGSFDTNFHQITDSVVRDSQTKDNRKRERLSDHSSNEPSSKRARKSPKKTHKSPPLPIGVVRSQNMAQTQSNVTRALQHGLQMIRDCPSPISSQSETNRRKRPLSEIAINETETDTQNESEPPLKKHKISATQTPTPILSQESDVTESEPETTPYSPVSRRHTRLHAIKHDNGKAYTSVICGRIFIQERKERYLRVYRERLLRIYSAHKLQNKERIDEWMRKYGGDIDKLHELYVKICAKYDLIACGKYEGQSAECVNECEKERIKDYDTPKIRGIVVPKDINKSEWSLDTDTQGQKSELTVQNVAEHTQISNEKRRENDTGSDTSRSTFQTPKHGNGKDSDAQSMNTENEKMDSKSFFRFPQKEESNKQRTFFHISAEEMKGSNEGWDMNDTSVFNNAQKFDFLNGFSFSGGGGQSNNNQNQSFGNDFSNNNMAQSEYKPMEFSLPNTAAMDTEPNNNNGNVNFGTMNNNQNQSFMQFGGNNNNSLWNNNPFNGNDNPQNNNNNSFTFGNAPNSSNHGWNAPNANNDNQYNFGVNNGDNGSGLSRGVSVASSNVDQSFFTQTPKSNRAKYKASKHKYKNRRGV